MKSREASLLTSITSSDTMSISMTILFTTPFRSRTLDKIELLRPKPSFYAMLAVASICISWICTILVMSWIQYHYKDISEVSFTEYALYTLLITGVTSLLSILAVNRFFALYELNIKNAFKQDYGKKFLKLDDV